MTRFDEILEGKHALADKKRLCVDKAPKEIPPLPSGKEALTPSTKAGWQTEGIKRALISNLHNGTDWKTLYIYGGSGKAMRNWKAFSDTIELLDTLAPNETLFMQSGVPYGKTLTHADAPRVVITNSIIVPNWTQGFPQMVKAGLTVYGQMTAGSWIYIGTQGILQGTYETCAAAIKSAEQKKSSRSDFEKMLVVSAGLGSMSGAQPLAFKMNNKVALIAEVDERQIKRMIEIEYLDVHAKTIEEGIATAQEYAARSEPVSIGVQCNAIDLLAVLVAQKITPLILTDQTSAHDIANPTSTTTIGYCPQGMSVKEALDLIKNNVDDYRAKAQQSAAKHVGYMLTLMKRGSETFDYGNNLRAAAVAGGEKDAFAFPGFVPAYIRPLFCEGKGPFRWAALSNDPKDIHVTDEYAKKMFVDDAQLVNWIDLASTHVPFEKGLPARVFWAGYKRRAAFGMLLNKLYADKLIKAPVIIGRDHLDGGSVASPNRETEGMKDGSDAIGDYAVLNLLGNALCGASWVSYHNGGGVGVGNSLHAGQVCVADGTQEMQDRLFRVLMWDPMSAVLRHAHAGYEKAQKIAQENNIAVGSGSLQGMDYDAVYEEICEFVKERTGIELFSLK